jgi:ParB family chromosome partitioning protein
MTDKPRRLGRGLGALIADATPTGVPAEVAPTPDSPFREIPVAEVHPNPLQPRQSFNPDELAELESSLRVSGLLQPITVRQRKDGEFELIAGERRLRAASRLGWATITAQVKPLDDRDMLVLALVENLQRADLNPLDEAMGYQRLLTEFAYTQQQVAQAVGKDRSTVANLLRVLTLPDAVRQLLREDRISLGHARALLAFDDAGTIIPVARQIVDKGLSVRDVERMAQERRAPAVPARTPQAPPAPRRTDQHTDSAELRRLTDLLRRRLQTDVQIQVQGDSRGTVAITFYSADDLHRVMELILGQPLDDA